MSIHRIALSSGHSKLDPGAISPQGTKEYDLNLPLVREIMKACPKSAYYWRSDFDAENEKYPEHLRHTVRNINNSDAVCCMEIHHNSCSNPGRKGAELIYWDSSQEGYLLAKYIARMFMGIPLDVQVIPAIKRLGRKLYFLRKTKIPAVVIEPTFMSHPDGVKLAIDKRSEIAMAIHKAVSRWLDELYS